MREASPFLVPLNGTRAPLVLKLTTKAKLSNSRTYALLQDKFCKSLIRLLHHKIKRTAPMLAILRRSTFETLCPTLLCCLLTGRAGFCWVTN